MSDGFGFIELQSPSGCFPIWCRYALRQHLPRRSLVKTSLCRDGWRNFILRHTTVRCSVLYMGLLLVACASELCSPDIVGLLLHRQYFHTEPAQPAPISADCLLGSVWTMLSCQLPVISGDYVDDSDRTLLTRCHWLPSRTHADTGTIYG